MDRKCRGSATTSGRGLLMGGGAGKGGAGGDHDEKALYVSCQESLVAALAPYVVLRYDVPLGGKLFQLFGFNRPVLSAEMCVEVSGHDVFPPSGSRCSASTNGRLMYSTCRSESCSNFRIRARSALISASLVSLSSVTVCLKWASAAGHHMPKQGAGQPRLCSAGADAVIVDIRAAKRGAVRCRSLGPDQGA